MAVNAKKIAFIAGSVLLLAAIVSCIALLVVNHKPCSDDDEKNAAHSGPTTSTSVKAIQSLCQPTGYRKTCETELTKSAGDTTDMKSLIKTALEIPINHLKEAYNRSDVLAIAAKDPANAGALEDCREYFDSAIRSFESVVEEYVGYDLQEALDKIAYDITTLISGACTYQYDCLDGLNNDTNKAAEPLKLALNKSLELSSNALTIARQIEKFVGDYNVSSVFGEYLGGSRRLLEDGSPSWLSAGRRRLLQMAPWQMNPVVVVAKDGSGQFKSIAEGLKAMPRENHEYVVMYVKEGVYEEQVIVDRKLNKLIIVGDGPTKTRVTGRLNVKMGGRMSTFRTATFAVIGDEFMAKDIGFENTAGPEGHQAVAFRSQSDRSVLYNCHFDGYQDTLYAHTMRQFYRDCTISGTVDFIFGDSISIFQNCLILLRKPLPNQQNIVTAHGSKEKSSDTIFILHNCSITAEPALVPLIATNPSYLGRPWKPYARTIFMQSDIDGAVHTDGWLPWGGEPNSVNTCFYAEIDNRGAGADKSKRVKWPGVHEIGLDGAQKYTVASYFREKEWPKLTGVPVIDGLLPAA